MNRSVNVNHKSIVHFDMLFVKCGIGKSPKAISFPTDVSVIIDGRYCQLRFKLAVAVRKTSSVVRCQSNVTDL